jgi:hypothetical protein
LSLWHLFGIKNSSSEMYISRTNAMRSSLGLSPLKENNVLNIAAAQKLQDMAENQYFAHFSPEGISPWHWFQVNQYSYTYAGENLAIGFLDAESTVNAWANSASHRRNLVNEHYQEIGIAAAQGKIKDMEGIIVVQLFGTPAQQVVAAKSSFSLGLSKSAAQDIPATSPTALPSPSISATPMPARMTPTLIAQNTTAPTVPATGVSTDDVFTKVAASDPAPALRSVGKVLNNTFVLYAFIIALASIVALMFGELRRELLVSATLHLAIFALAALVPLMSMARLALIL